jgi:hypothetical protein
VDAAVHSEHVQVIRCDIERESIEKYREIENERIPGKKQGTPQAPFFTHRHVFLRIKTVFLIPSL